MPDPGRPTYADLPGWFRWLDKTMFDAVLGAQAGTPPGDLVDLGAYLGRSSVVIGAHLRPGERLVAVDLFGADPADFEPERAVHAANRRENRRSYASLDRARFEAGYRSVLDDLPVVVTSPTSLVRDHVPDGSARFVHVDASHLYENVLADSVSARAMLRPDGVVVFNDYRSEHTPGVAAVVWEAVANDGLQPFALSTGKLYATYGDGAAYAAALEALARPDQRYAVDVEEIRGRPVLRLGLAKEPAAAPTLKQATLEELQAVADELARTVRGDLDTASGSSDGGRGPR